VSTICWNSLISISAAGVQIGSARNNRSRPSVLIQDSLPVRRIQDSGADASRVSSAFGLVDLSTDFHNSFESHPSRKPFPRQLEPHCVNPATPIRITNKLSLTTINYRATMPLIVRAHLRPPSAPPHLCVLGNSVLRSPRPCPLNSVGRGATIQVLSLRHYFLTSSSVSPLAATFTHLPVSVANKRLTV